MNKKNKKRRTIQKKPGTMRISGIRNGSVLLAVFVLLTSGVIMYSLSPDTHMRKYGGNSGQTYDVTFHKEGELVFIDSIAEEVKKEIDIEIADSDYERAKGLMHRRSMKENQGMLFIFEGSAVRHIWMKNTYISLDILFVNENFEIVKIYKNSIPLSTRNMSSYHDAMYAVEVVAGFCDVYNITEGDRIRIVYGES